MKSQALVVAALLACGSTAFAQSDRPVTHTDRTDRNARVEQRDHDNSADNARSSMHRLGEKMRSGMHRLEVNLHAHNDRHSDTHAMGASRGDDRRDADASRRNRMDDAYANWKDKHEHDRDHDRDTSKR